MVSHLLALAFFQTALDLGAARAEAIYTQTSENKKKASLPAYRVVRSGPWGVRIESEDRWDADVLPDGALSRWSAKYETVGAVENDGAVLTEQARRDSCLRMLAQAGIDCELRFHRETPGNGPRPWSWYEQANPVRSGIVFIDPDYFFEVGATTGRVYEFVLGDSLNEPSLPPLPSQTKPLATASLARSAVASVAFAWGKDVSKRMLAVPATMVEETEETVLAAWTPRRTAEASAFQSLSDEDVALGARGETQLVWWVRLRTVPEGDVKAVSNYVAKVNALTGRLVDLWVSGPVDALGAPGPSKRRLPIALSGPGSLTYGGKTRAVRLVPVATTRLFTPGGRSVLSVGKAVLSAEYDTEAGLVRFQGRLARVLEGKG